MLPLATLWLACLAQSASPDEATRAWPGAEGPLANDAFLPRAAAVEEALARGDEAFARGRPDAEIFDHWHDALAAAQPGDAVVPRPVGALAVVPSPWPDPDGTAERRTEGVERSVLRRLWVLDPARREGWIARFAGLAQEELAAAGARPGALEAVERRHPATPAALRAALALADLAFEEGHTALAATWLARAREHAELDPGCEGALLATRSGPSPEPAGGSLQTALDVRAAALAELEPAPAAAQRWETAVALRPVGFLSLPAAPGARPLTGVEPSPGLGVQPGVCFLADGTAVVQTAERLHLIDPVRGELRGEVVPAAAFERAHWIAGEAASRASEPPGWPLLPLAHGNAVIAVQGRTVERAANVLVCFDVEATPLEGARRASLRWALRGDELLAGERVRRNGLDLAGIEFQPGLVALGSELFVQVREVEARQALDRHDRPVWMPTEDQVSSWLVAIDLVTGGVRWKRFLAKGLPLARGDVRYGMPLPAVSAAQPLALVGGRIFAGTHLGAAALVEADGRLLWSFKNRRRAMELPGWSGAAPPVLGAGAGLLWAPADSDHLYWLRPDGGGRRGEQAFLPHAPRAIGEAEVLLGGGAAEALVLARAGRERNASAWRADSGGRQDAAYLGPGERFTGGGLVSPERVLFATQRGLVLLDRTRELYLLDYAPLGDPTADPGSSPAQRAGRARAGEGRPRTQDAGRGGPAPEKGGTVWARGERVLVAGPLGVWLFAPE